MKRKLALTLIVAGTIGTFAGLWNVRKAEEISRNIRNEPRYSQLTEDKMRRELDKNPLIKRNEIYGGLAAAGAVASAGLVLLGSYSFKEKRYKNYPK